MMLIGAQFIAGAPERGRKYLICHALTMARILHSLTETQPQGTLEENRDSR